MAVIFLFYICGRLQLLKSFKGVRNPLLKLIFGFAQTYLSTRRGAWIARRVGPNGVPIDAFLSTRLKNYIRHLLPESVTNEYAENFLNGTFNHEAYGLKPKHRYNAQHPTMNDSLPNKILSGFVRVKKNIVEFTEDGVLFEGDDEVSLGTCLRHCGKSNRPLTKRAAEFAAIRRKPGTGCIRCSTSASSVEGR